MNGGLEMEEDKQWIIQRCTQRWAGTELQYEDFPTLEGLMTRSRMVEALDRVSREHPGDEFRGHRVVGASPSRRVAE